MAKRISELPAAGAVADTDELELNQSGTSRKATRAQIVAGLAPANHEHTLADISDAGALAAKDAVGEADIEAGAVTTGKLAEHSVTTAKIAPKAVGPEQLADTGVTPGVFTLATITVDPQGRITAAASGTAGDAITGSNVGEAGFGVFAGKVGSDLQFRHIAAASNRISITLDGADIVLDVDPSHLEIDASNVTGLAAVATAGTLAALTSLDAGGRALTNHLAPQDTVSGGYTFVQADSGREKVFAGSSAATWTIPALNAGTHAVVHNLGAAPLTFVANGVTLIGLTTLAAEKTAAVSWLPGNVVKLTGELS